VLPVPARALPPWRGERLQLGHVLSPQALQAIKFTVEVPVEVAALSGQRLLIERVQVRVVLAEHASDPGQRPFLGFGQVGDHLDDGPLAGSAPAPQPGFVGPADQGPQHDRGCPERLQDLLAPVQHPPILLLLLNLVPSPIVD